MYSDIRAGYKDLKIECVLLSYIDGWSRNTFEANGKSYNTQ